MRRDCAAFRVMTDEQLLPRFGGRSFRAQGFPAE